MDEDAAECPNVVLGGYDVWSALVASLYLTFGVVLTLYGYRCFKATLFLVGMSGGACLTWAMCRLGGLPAGSAGEAAGALGAGTLVGLASMQAPRLGLALTGLHAGVLAAAGSVLIAFPWVRPAASWHVAALAAALGLTGALASALFFHKGMTIVGSALCGGAAVAGSCDYFMERLAMARWVWAVLQLEPPAPEPCWLSWLLLALWPGLSLLGTLVQWRLTGKGCHHSVSGLPRRTRQVDLQRIRQEEHRAEQKQQKYRYLYQVRTAHGDVISQNFIQGLQKKVVPPLDDSFSADLTRLDPTESTATSMSQLPL